MGCDEEDERTESAAARLVAKVVAGSTPTAGVLCQHFTGRPPLLPDDDE